MYHKVIIGIIVIILGAQSCGDCQDVNDLRRELAEVKRELNELKMAGCKPKAGLPKLDISGENYVVQSNGKVQLVLVARGTVKNSGAGDARNVVITTECSGCASTAQNGTWMDAAVALKSRNGMIISHLPAGESRDFAYPAALKVTPVSFGGIVRSVPSKPAGLKTRIVSFDGGGK